MSVKAMASSSSTASASARSGPADEATRKLVAELKTLAVDVLGRGIERMFDGADDMLFEMARRATNNKDQRVYFDTMRVVRLGRPKIGQIFREEIAKGFDPASAEDDKESRTSLAFEDMSLQESKSLEESIAISTMATKAEGLYAPVLFELGRRIEWLIKEHRAPLATTAIAPATISNAFRRSAQALDVEFDIEIVIFKLFDRLVISDLGELYTRTLRFFDQHGVRAAQIGGGLPPRTVGGAGAMPAAGSLPPGAPPGDAGVYGAPATGGGGYGTAASPNGYGFATPPMMDANTLNALRSMSSMGGMGGFGGMGGMGGPMGPAAGAGYYSDMQLGTDLVAAAQGQIVPGWESARAYSYVQRSGAVGRMFNDLLEDPTLPAPLKPRFDQLRFAVIKNALHDGNFFADRQHPVRSLMSELTSMAATARASGMEALKRIEELVGQIQGQFDVAADSIRSQTALPGAVDEKTLEEFFDQQKDEARNRRQAIIEKTRRIVAEELQLHTLSRKIPDAVWPLLNSGWAPLMALRLLKQGPDSEGWHNGLLLLRQLLDSVDPRRPDMRAESVRDKLAIELESQLREIGMLPERIGALIRSWKGAVDSVETDVSAAPLPARQKAPIPIRTPPGTATAPAAEGGKDGVSAGAGSTAIPLDEIPFGDDPVAPANDAEIVESDDARVHGADQVPPSAVTAEAATAEAVAAEVVDPVTLLDLLMVLSSWFRVYDHDRSQNRWLKVIGHNPANGTVTFAEFNGQNKLQMRTQVFLDDLVANRAEPIDLGPAARRALESYLLARRSLSAATP